MRRSADAEKPTYIEDKDSGELRRPHHIDLKTGISRPAGTQGQDQLPEFCRPGPARQCRAQSRPPPRSIFALVRGEAAILPFRPDTRGPRDRFPLLLIPFAIYNMIAFLTGRQLDRPIYSVPLNRSLAGNGRRRVPRLCAADADVRVHQFDAGGKSFIEHFCAVSPAARQLNSGWCAKPAIPPSCCSSWSASSTCSRALRPHCAGRAAVVAGGVAVAPRPEPVRVEPPHGAGADRPVPSLRPAMPHADPVNRARAKGRPVSQRLRPATLASANENTRFPSARPLARLCARRNGRDLAPARKPRGDRNAQSRRHGGGCGSRRRRGVVRGRAGDDRHRRRLLLPCGARKPVWGYNGSGRAAPQSPQSWQGLPRKIGTSPHAGRSGRSRLEASSRRTAAGLDARAQPPSATPRTVRRRTARRPVGDHVASWAACRHQNTTCRRASPRSAACACRRSPRRAARSRPAARERSIRGRSPPTSWRRSRRPAACWPRKTWRATTATS